MTAEAFVERHGPALLQWLQTNTVECACSTPFGPDENLQRGTIDLTTSIAGDDAVAISAAVSVPIWAQGAAARERAANARARAHDAEAIRIELDLVELLETLLTDIDASARKIALYEGEMIGQAEAAAASARHAFEVGRASVAELLTAQRAVLEVQLELVGARHDHAVAWSSLNALAGAPVERSMIGDR